MCGGCKGKKCIGGKSILVARIEGRYRLMTIDALAARGCTFELVTDSGLSKATIKKTGRAIVDRFEGWSLFVTPEHEVLTTGRVPIMLDLRAAITILEKKQQTVYDIVLERGSWVVFGPYFVAAGLGREKVETECSEATK